jgi:histone H3/H4
MQRRKRVNVADLLAGLVRKGELTLYVLAEAGVDPDAIYAQILSYNDTKTEEPGEDHADLERPSAKKDQDSAKTMLKRLVASFIVREKREFAPEAIATLSASARRAQGRRTNREGCAIAEQDLLEEIMASPEWERLRSVGLPSREIAQAILNKKDVFGIDENGLVTLRDLDVDARRIIHDAHALAQQRGVFPISNRILLAVLLDRRDGYAARVCRAAETWMPADVLRQIIRASVDENRQGESFGLSRKACARIVSPVLETARRLAGRSKTIAEQHIFRAYCERADPGFKAVLKQKLHLDLDRLKTVDPRSDILEKQAGLDVSVSQTDIGRANHRVPDLSSFNENGRRVVDRAAELARASRRKTVNSPHLFAAMIDCRTGALATLLGSRPEKAVRLRNMALSVLEKCTEPLGDADEPVFSPHTLDILDRAQQIALASKRSKVSGNDLFAAFFADGGGLIGQMLTLLGLQALSSRDSGGNIGPLFGKN